MNENREEKIRSRAYQLWESEGRPEGRELHHWEQASQEFQSEGDSGSGGQLGAGDNTVPESQPMGEGLGSDLQPGGTIPGGGPGGGLGQLGSGGGSTAGMPSGTAGRRRK